MKYPWIKLTNPDDDQPSYFNMERIVTIDPDEAEDEEGRGTALSTGDNTFLVKESIETVIYLITEAQSRV